MTLIWLSGVEPGRELAPLWQRHALANARANDGTLQNREQTDARIEAHFARKEYDSAIGQIDQSLDTGTKQASTHALIIGVSNYRPPGIRPVSTAVHGARAFTEWLLTSFRHAHRPLGSVELLLSPTAQQGSWTPSPEAAARLGLKPGGPLPVETATFANIKAAFARWIARAGTSPDNAGFCYFAGHGVWKAGSLLLPEDARLPTGTQPPDNLIDIEQTERNLFNTPPRLYCFFLDSCQELSPSLLHNLAAAPGEPLHRPTNRAAIGNRSSWVYRASEVGRKAYGPEHDIPFFTQELLACLRCRAAHGITDDNNWAVTPSSLSLALGAASLLRREKEKEAIQFSAASQESSFVAELCHIPGPPEVFVGVRCTPLNVMLKARLYVESGGKRNCRATALPHEWYTTVVQGAFLVGAEFEAAVQLVAEPKRFDAYPPVHRVHLPVLEQGE